MHLTTIVSLLAAGAAAAPAPRSLDLNTKMARPSLLARRDAASPSLGGLPKVAEVTELARRQEEEEPSSSSSAPASSSSGLIPGLPIPVRRQEPEPTGAPSGHASFREFTEEQDRKVAAEPEDPLDAYLDTFTADGDYDEADQDAKLQAYLDSLKPEHKTAGKPSESEDDLEDFPIVEESEEEPKAASNATSEKPAAPAAPKNETAADKTDELPTNSIFDFKKLMGLGKEDEETKPSNTTSEEPAAPAAPKNETAAEKTDELPTHDLTKGLDFKKLMGGEAPEKNETSAEPAAPKKNETESAVPKNETAPAAESSSSSSDPVSGLLGGLPLGGLPVKKRQDLIPELPGLTPRQAEEVKPATPVEDEKKVTAPANTTSAQPSGTGNSGFYGINKHMEKLDKLDALPIGGLPVKRNAFEEGDRFDSRFEQPSQPQGVAQPSGFAAAHAQPQGVAQPTGAPVVNTQPTEMRGGDRTDARMSRTNKPQFKTDAPAKPQGKPASGSPLDKFLVPLKRQQQEPAAAAAAPSGPSKASQAAAAPTGEKPEEKPEEKSEESSPLAALFGEKEAGAEKNATKPEGKPESEEDESPFASLLGKKPEAPTESKGEAPAPSAPKDAPAESSSAPASPLAGLMGRAITEQHEEFSPEMVKPSSAAGEEPTSSEPSVEDILKDFA